MKKSLVQIGKRACPKREVFFLLSQSGKIENNTTVSDVDAFVKNTFNSCQHFSYIYCSFETVRYRVTQFDHPKNGTRTLWTIKNVRVRPKPDTFENDFFPVVLTLLSHSECRLGRKIIANVSSNSLSTYFRNTAYRTCISYLPNGTKTNYRYPFVFVPPPL